MTVCYFDRNDFKDPLHSPVFAALEKHSDARLKALGRFVRAQLKTDLQNIPYLELPLPQFLEEELNFVSEAAPVIERTDALDTVPQKWTVPAKPTQQAAWIKPGDTKRLQQHAAAQSASQIVNTPVAHQSTTGQVKTVVAQLPAELVSTNVPRKGRVEFKLRSHRPS